MQRQKVKKGHSPEYGKCPGMDRIHYLPSVTTKGSRAIVLARLMAWVNAL